MVIVNICIKLTEVFYCWLVIAINMYRTNICHHRHSLKMPFNGKCKHRDEIMMQCAIYSDIELEISLGKSIHFNLCFLASQFGLAVL